MRGVPRWSAAGAASGAPTEEKETAKTETPNRAGGESRRLLPAISILLLLRGRLSLVRILCSSDAGGTPFAAQG